MRISKRQAAFLSILFFVAALTGIWHLFAPSSVEKVVDQTIAERQSEGTTEQDSKTKTDADDAKKTDLSPEELLEASASLQKKKAMQEAANRGMPFYGKVVDQHGRPVPGATVHYRYAYYPDTTLPTFSWSVRQDVAITSENGEFQIEGVNGVHLTVVDIIKSGYKIKASQLFQYRPRTVDDEAFQPDPANPVIFYAWKKGSLPSELKRGEERFTIPPNGETYTVKLPEFEESVRVAFEYTNEAADTDTHKRCCWKATLSVNGGGVIESDDQFMYEAPQVGYQTSWETSAPEHQNVQKRFYLMGKDGRVYGRIEMYLRGYYGQRDKGYIDYKYWVNPTGSRNLLTDTN